MTWQVATMLSLTKSSSKGKFVDKFGRIENSSKV